MIPILSTLKNQPPEIRACALILQAALDAADPERCVADALQPAGGRLRAGSGTYEPALYDRVFLIGAGKAAFPMALAASAALGRPIAGGAVIVKHMPEDGSGLERQGIRVFPGNHPVPGDLSIKGTRAVMGIAESAGANDLVLFTLSGGASSLLTAPREGLVLSDLQELTGLLLACGADIGEINTLRKHLDEVKGGGLARLAAPAAMLVLVLSDVVGSPLEVIGSGPAAGDKSTFAAALDILQKYRLVDRTPKNVLRILQDGREGCVPETVRPDDPIMKRVHHVIVGSVGQSARAALRAVLDLGWEGKILTTAMTGEAREKGREYGRLLAGRAARGGPPFCLIAGGETTVTIRGDGIGGRNLELALAAVEEMAGVPGAALVTLATDGDDGVSGAAGALVTGDTLAKAAAAGIHPADFLENNDSFHFFQKAGGLLTTGPTGTNVNDLVFLFGGLR